MHSIRGRDPLRESVRCGRLRRNRGGKPPVAQLAEVRVPSDDAGALTLAAARRGREK